MITICNIRNTGEERGFDEVWAIVRSLKSKSSRLTQVQELSPSWNLFQTYLGLKDRGEWGEKAFAEIYTPQFMQEMQSAPAQRKLNELIQKHNEGKHIALCCFCTDVSLCHRSLIAKILQERGVTISEIS